MHTEKETAQQVESVDLLKLLKDYTKYLRRFWAFILALTVICGGAAFMRRYRAYVPMYESSAVFSVSSGYSSTVDIINHSYYYDNEAAEQMALSFPYLLNTDIMKELIY